LWLNSAVSGRYEEAAPALERCLGERLHARRSTPRGMRRPGGYLASARGGLRATIRSPRPCADAGSYGMATSRLDARLLASDAVLGGVCGCPWLASPARRLRSNRPRLRVLDLARSGAR
jgi:hypothetical protein